jgi:hypothetical protein
MTPKTTTQNLLLWAAAFALAIVLSFLGALAEQLPGDAPINWRIVLLNVVQTILSTAPIIAAGFGLPRLGKEPIAALVHEVGAGPAKSALEVEAVKQATGVNTTLTDADVERVTDELLRRRDLATAAALDDERQAEGRG